MARRMSCSLTVDQVRARTKTETRRAPETWKHLRPGDRLILVEKAMGLPKGARQVILAEVEVTAAEVVYLFDITAEEVAAEGFPDWSRQAFCRFWLDSHGHTGRADPDTRCRRIAWRYLEEADRG